MSSPSSRMKPQVRYLGTAPIIRRSLTVPQTQSLPMSPPLKTRGVTTKESVLQAILPPTSSTAASSILSSTPLEKCFPNISPISCALLLPPLPWAIVIFILFLLSVYFCTRFRSSPQMTPYMGRRASSAYRFHLQTSGTDRDLSFR